MNFGPYPEKRELPSFVRKQTGEELALKLLRQQDALDSLHQKELADVQRKADRLAEQLALLVHKKRFTENDPFVMSLRQLLKNEGIILRTYVGEEVTEILEDEADIVEWLPPREDPVDRVEDALEPEILWHGQVLHRAKLSCRQAAEEEAAEMETEAVEDSIAVEAAEASADAEAAADLEDGAAEALKDAASAGEAPDEDAEPAADDKTGNPEEEPAANDETADPEFEPDGDYEAPDPEEEDSEEDFEKDSAEERDSEKVGFFKGIIDRIGRWLSGEP